MIRHAILFLALALALPAAAQGSDADSQRRLEAAKSLEVFSAIYRNLDLMYVDTLNPKQLVGTGIRAMLRTLDPYSEYYPEDESDDLRELFTGKFGGIGSIIRWNQQLRHTVISEPYAGMPAAEAGLRKGDIVVAIDAESMAGKDTKYVSDHLRGDPGTSFILTYRRPGQKREQKVKLTRAIIQKAAIPYCGMAADGQTAYLALSGFTEGCAKEMRRALLDLRQQGMRRLVLDLRDNGGGSEQEAADIVALFVPKGSLVVSNRGKQEKVNHDYRTTTEPLDSVMPLAVLVNDGTASASEIVSGALQDYDRAVIVGSRTYGKGLVQSSIGLPYNGNMKFTTYRYHIPSGRCIQALNYKHTTRGYAAEHVADSLCRVFRTAHGREVRDGGGITPDVEVRPDTISNLCAYLSVRDTAETMLGFVVDYIQRHPQVAQPEEFTLTDAEFNDFKARVIAAKFSYDHETERALKDLEALAKFEGYYDSARAEFDALRAKLVHNVEQDLDFRREELVSTLADEILPAYYYEAGPIRYNLRTDKAYAEALRIVADTARYHEILRP